MQPGTDIHVASLIGPDALTSILRALIYAAAGFLVLRIIVALTRRLTRRRLTDQARMLLTKGISYFGLAVLIIIVLLELGINLTPLLGAAGVVGIVIGVASQASISNVISGFFLISEKPFAVGDIIRSGDNTGIVLSIDLLSVKIRTFDNLFVRIPSQEIVNGTLTNITRFPIRRMDFNLRVAYKEDINRVRDLLLEIAKSDPGCLDEPAPLVLFREFGDSGIDILFGVWFSKPDFLTVKNSVFEAIKRRFNEEAIEIPFPHRTLYAGSTTGPLPIRLEDAGPAPSS